jgi:hypothetical protein
MEISEENLTTRMRMAHKEIDSAPAFGRSTLASITQPISMLKANKSW